jgi:hypothetical protein
MSVERVKDRKDEDIHEGDEVWTRFRGGVRQGEVRQRDISLPLYTRCIDLSARGSQVEKIVTDEREAREEDVKNPPKVRAQVKIPFSFIY